MKKIISLFILFFFASCDFAPGSYPYAEIYEFDVSEKKEIEARKLAFIELLIV